MQLSTWHENISVGGVHPNVGNTPNIDPFSEHAADERRDYTDHLESIGEDRETDPTRGYNQSAAQKALKGYIAEGREGLPLLALGAAALGAASGAVGSIMDKDE